MSVLMRLLRADDVYQEFQPLLKMLQLYGLAPFFVKGGRPKPSKLFILHFAAFAAELIYCLYDTWVTNNSDRLSKYSLTVVLYDVMGLVRCCYGMFAQGKHILQVRTFIQMWTGLEGVNGELYRLGVEPHRSKLQNAAESLTLIGVLAAFTIFTYNLQTQNSQLTLTFWSLWYIPLFQSCLMELVFYTFCSELRRKTRLANRLLSADVFAVENRSPFRSKTSSVRLVRALRENHYRIYEISKDLNVMYGQHFLYIFVMYFISGTMDFCNIIRLYKSASASAAVRYKSAVFWTLMQLSEILVIVFGGVLLKKEVRRTAFLVHKYLILLDDDEPHLKLELQSFSMQLMQCQLKFTAADFFQIDCTLLIQFGIGIISNGLFFVQIDTLKNKRNS